MGIGITYKCECGYAARIVEGPTMVSRDGAQFEGATCDTCHELVSVPMRPHDESGEAECPYCNSQVRLFRNQEGISCPRCDRNDGWEPDQYISLVD